MVVKPLAFPDVLEVSCCVLGDTRVVKKLRNAPEIGFIQRLTRQRILNEASIDGFNLALNIGYAALKKEVWSAVFLAALNPYAGFLHKPRSGKMSLVFDLIEEFRPVAVDRPLVAFARKEKEVIRNLPNNRGETLPLVWRQVVSTIYGNEMAMKRV